MTVHDRIKDEKLQYVINRETAEILVLSLRKKWCVLMCIKNDVMSYRWRNFTLFKMKL